MASRNPATLTDKLLTASLLLILLFSDRAILLGHEPGSGREIEQHLQTARNLRAL